MRKYLNLGELSHLECVVGDHTMDHCIVRVVGTAGSREYDTAVVLADKAFRQGEGELWDVRLLYLQTKWANPLVFYKSGERIELPTIEQAMDFVRKFVCLDIRDRRHLMDLCFGGEWVDANNEPANPDPGFRAMRALWLVYGIQNDARSLASHISNDDPVLNEYTLVKYVMDAYSQDRIVGVVSRSRLRDWEAFADKVRQHQEVYNEIRDSNKPDVIKDILWRCKDRLYDSGPFLDTCGDGDYVKAIETALEELIDVIETGCKAPVKLLQPFSPYRYPGTIVEAD